MIQIVFIVRVQVCRKGVWPAAAISAAARGRRNNAIVETVRAGSKIRAIVSWKTYAPVHRARAICRGWRRTRRGRDIRNGSGGTCDSPLNEVSKLEHAA